MSKFKVNHYYYATNANGDLNAILVCERSAGPVIISATADTRHLFAVDVRDADSSEHLTFNEVEFNSDNEIPFAFGKTGCTVYATVNGIEIATIGTSPDEITRHAELFAAVFGPNSPSILSRIKVALFG